MICTISAQVITDPLAFAVNIQGNNASKSYYKLELSINNDGVNDVLLARQESQQEIAENKWLQEDGHIPFQQNEHSFATFIGLKTGGYAFSDYIIVDLDQCYIGYIDEVKQYGILTINYGEEGGSDKGYVYQKVICYTVSGNKIKKTGLTPRYALGDKNPIYDKYLSPSKRTQVQLQTVTP